MRKSTRFSGSDIQVVLGTLLRVGVVTSMSVISVGALIYLYVHHRDLVDYEKFDALHAANGSFAQALSGLLAADGGAIIQVGILLLIFTPVLRVLFSVFSFLIERDYLYVTIGIFVLVVIVFSLSNKLAV